MLDTDVGSSAEGIYRRMGYIEVSPFYFHDRMKILLDMYTG